MHCNLVPRPCGFVACSTKFSQKACYILSCDVCYILRHNYSTEVSNVLRRWASALFSDQRGLQRSQQWFVCELTWVLKVSAAKEHKLPYDIYILNQIPWPHRVFSSNLDSSSSSSLARVYYHSLLYTCDLFQVLLTPFLQHGDICYLLSVT